MTAVVTIATAVYGLVAEHAWRVWRARTPSWLGALLRVVVLGAAAFVLTAYLGYAALAVRAPGPLWLHVVLVVLAVCLPWVVLWAPLTMQTARLDEPCRRPRTSQAVLHLWLTTLIGSCMLMAYLPSFRGASTVVSGVLVVLMALGFAALPGFRRELVKLWTPRARVAIRRASPGASRVVLCGLCIWWYLHGVACSQDRCAAGAGLGVGWALVYSAGWAWLIATSLMQAVPALLWLERHSGDPGPPPPWLRRLIRAG
jgi:hypothetical protein